MSRKILLASAALAAIGTSHPAWSQATAPAAPAPATGPSASDRVARYEAAFFASFAPRTALDIARRVPGFTLDLGSNQGGGNEVRGFAGAAGNVVFNGARPSSKADSLETILSRIPANRVVRVEAGPGDLYGAEYSGKSQVLNIIMSAESGVDGNITTSVRRDYEGGYTPNLAASALIKRGASTFNVSAGSERNDGHEEGTDLQLDATTGATIEHRRRRNVYRPREPFIAGSYALEQAANKSARLNARYSHGTFTLDQKNHVTPANGPERDDTLSQDFKTPALELGGDITRPLAGGAIKLVGLATRRTRDNVETYRLRRDGQTLGGFEQTQNAKRNETLARLSWNRADVAGFSFETGGEAVLNTLDSAVTFSRLGANDEKTRIPLPLANATVEEKRGEAFVNVGRSLSSSLRLDGGLTYEYSKLKVRGDTTADRKLGFLKPNATIDWKPGGGWHTQLSVRRNVAQLDFYDFISSAELANDRVNGGNSELLPQRAWEFRGTIDHAILGQGLVKLDVGYDHISLLQDRTLTNGFDAPGNIGTGRRAFARLSIDAPLGSLGLTGTRLKINGQIQRTRVEDPLTGEMRNFSGFYPDWNWDVELRRDAGKFSYGMTVLHRDSFSFFRTDEIDTFSNGGPYALAFVEYRPSNRTAITFDVDNLFDTPAKRVRQISLPNRATPTRRLDEFRERNRHAIFRLTLKQSFGGGGSAK
ncbi:MAG TPA: outer membrane beta-barrel protein [Sphingomicrobium sp.]|nr:outer membrane beta-barrel protein [Sphingomicrobium sp.]